MKILLTNDDGINAEGLKLLYKKLQKYGDVLVCAPKNHQSAKSCAITLDKLIVVEQLEKNVYSCDAFPADCAEFALTTLANDIDLVISGCNDGLNISYDVNYSGTVGTCLQGLKHRIPSMAISCHGNFEIVDNYFDKVMDFVLSHKLLSTEYLLNINFPRGEVVKDIRIGKLHYRKDYTYYVKEDGAYKALRDLKEEPLSEDSDVFQVNHGIVSIVPLGKTFYNDSYFVDLIKKIN